MCACWKFSLNLHEFEHRSTNRSIRKSRLVNRFRKMALFFGPNSKQTKCERLIVNAKRNRDGSSLSSLSSPTKSNEAAKQWNCRFGKNNQNIDMKTLNLRQSETFRCLFRMKGWRNRYRKLDDRSSDTFESMQFRWQSWQTALRSVWKAIVRAKHDTKFTFRRLLHMYTEAQCTVYTYTVGGTQIQKAKKLLNKK